MSASEKKLGAMVPVQDYEEFKKSFPQYGSTNWLITTALKEVNRLVREGAGNKGIVERAIQESLLARRDSK